MVRRGKVRAVGGHDLQLCYFDRWWLELPKATLFKTSCISVIIQYYEKLIVAPRRMSYATSESRCLRASAVSHTGRLNHGKHQQIIRIMGDAQEPFWNNEG